MFAMDYSGRINDNIDDSTTEGSPLSARDPEVFYDSLHQEMDEWYYWQRF